MMNMRNHCSDTLKITVMTIYLTYSTQLHVMPLFDDHLSPNRQSLVIVKTPVLQMLMPTYLYAQMCVLLYLLSL